MAYFKDTRSPLGVEQLVVLDDERQPLDKGTTMVVHTSLIGRYPMQWPRLTSTYNINEWTHEVSLSKTLKVWTLQTSHHKYSDEIVHLPTLGNNIIKGKAMWGESLQFTGEFHYTAGYWEWTEDVLSRCESKLISAQIYDSVYASLFTYDRNSEIIKVFCEAWCPITNTLLTSLGELSLSLWDLNTLAGLPLTGLLYDEVIPCAEELCGIDATGSRYMPRTCKHLLHVYHLLRKKADDNSQVSIEKWIKFWSKKQLKYHQPPLRKERKKVRPKSTHNPLGSFDAHDEWDTAERELFSKLKIGNDLRTETYLSAFLACWLCTFVLPTDSPDTIRPSTFKMASLMASGRKVGLAVPVLASIYKGFK
ncbi:PREDICTED: uncharacterized protein LOC105949899 [Erythranthe guttata]|uniref:uncharacterized protein LOC105949899 n=1 Tax=Erythranthe guttata TaxID=4155 RepID=UPI00064D92B3|nr:PREDICTED: uncharacterized protein LOC105949899 [Erythranthe guttata]|eukprot:XP_012828660.1 PREDICTED: uncharacterized protein LOC105949899 [Erythranthe guttata]